MNDKTHVECHSKPHGARIYAIPKWRYETGAQITEFLIPEGDTNVKACLEKYTVYIVVFELAGRQLLREIDTSKHTSVEVTF